jgi:hypothetical protein
MSIRYLINTLLNIALGVIAFFLGLRIILQLFAANAATPFVSWTYSMSSGLMVPFRGIFPSAAIGQGSIFDIPAFIALIVYAIIFYLVIALINILFSSVEGSTRRIVREDERVSTRLEN